MPPPEASRDSSVVIPMSNVAAPRERPQRPAVSATVRASDGRRKGSRAWSLLGAGVIACLTGFNAWWYWRDTRPLPDLTHGLGLDATRAVYPR